MHWLTQHNDILFYSLLLLAIALPRIPFVGTFFRIINTLVHEAGHAFTTLILSGEVLEVNLFNDTSGNTVVKTKSKMAHFIISLAGYPVSILTAWLCFWFISKGLSLYVLFILASITLIIMILSIRNLYGLLWAGTFTVLNLLLIYFNQKELVHAAALFFTMVLMCESVYSAIVLLRLSLKQPKKAGDATNLQKTAKLPASFWALCFLALSVFITWIIIVHYFPHFPTQI